MASIKCYFKSYCSTEWLVFSATLRVYLAKNTSRSVVHIIVTINLGV